VGQASSDHRQTIATAGWLATTSPELRAALLQTGRLRELDPGELFNIAGDEQAGMWGVASGQVALRSAMNRPDIPVGYIYHVGDWGGYAPLFGYPRRGDVTARTAAVILFLPYGPLRRLLASNQAWWEDVGRLLVTDVFRFARWGSDLMMTDSRARVAAILLHQAGRRTGPDTPADVLLSQSELAAMSALSRHPVAAILHDFRKAGTISLSYGRIAIEQPAALRAIADGDGC
jgi:CRP-like cAMP-binding protein